MIINEVKKIIDLTNVPKKKKYNILTFPTHERYETQLCKTGHNFYSFHLPKLKKWNDKQIPIPSNYYILPESSISGINYDFILSQSKFWQFQIAMQINQKLQLPLISLEHTVPTPQTMNAQQVEMMKNMQGHLNVFISEYSQKSWGIQNNSVIIHHGIDTESFNELNKQRNKTVLTVANDFINRDYCLNYSGWKRVTAGLDVRVIGDTPGLSFSAKSTDELVNEYNQCGVYLNTSTLSPIPTSLLEAMSCGCAVVSTATCMIPEIIKHGENGLISNDETELRKYIENILNDDQLRNELGNNARDTIKQLFSEQQFITKWNNLLDTVYEVCRK
jgi:glycosyltransferase involved in cell wall biosynthesis